MTATGPIPCPMCGTENDPTSELCSVCGYGLQTETNNSGGTKCARCGSQVPGGYDFCPVCGQDQRRRFARPNTHIVRIDPNGEVIEAVDPSAAARAAQASDRTVPAPSFLRGSDDAEGQTPGMPGYSHGHGSHEHPGHGHGHGSHEHPGHGHGHGSHEHHGHGHGHGHRQGHGSHEHHGHGQGHGQGHGSHEHSGHGHGRGSHEHHGHGHGQAPQGQYGVVQAGIPQSPAAVGEIAAPAPPPPAKTGRTEFVQGPPLMRPPEVGDDDSTVPNPPVAPPAPYEVPSNGAVSPSFEAPSSTPTLRGSVSARMVLVGRDGEEGESYPMSSEVFSMGREHGDIRFSDDSFMSPQHARVERHGDAYSLVDAGSLNGVFLRIRTTASVYPGDLFMVGHQLLRLENITENLREQGPAADGTRAFGTPLKPAWGKISLIARGGIATDQYYLRGAKITFGRELGDILFPNDPFVSREHAMLRLEINGSAMQVFLEDLGSANGTYIRIRGSTEIRHEDTFRIGDQILRLRLDR